MPSKSILASKTFWFNVLTAAVSLIGSLPVPPEVAVPVVAVINIILRYVTTSPTHLVRPS